MNDIIYKKKCEFEGCVCIQKHITTSVQHMYAFRNISQLRYNRCLSI